MVFGAYRYVYGQINDKKIGLKVHLRPIVHLLIESARSAAIKRLVLRLFLGVLMPKYKEAQVQWLHRLAL